MTETFLFIALALLLYLLVRQVRLGRDIREIEDFVRELSRGNLRKRLFLKREDRFSGLVAGLNRIAEGFEEKIREAEQQGERLEATLRSLPDGIVLLDDEGVIRFVNPAFESLFNVDSSRLTGRSLNEAVRVPEVAELLDDISAGRQAEKREIHLESSDRYIQMRAVSLGYARAAEERAETGAMVIFRDVSERKKTDETRRDFVVNVSHELKTPITAIKGFAETLLDGAIEDGEDARRFLNTIKSHAERMERLVRDLIVLSRAELGAMPIRRKTLRFDSFTDDLFRGFSPLCRGKGLYLRREVSEECAEIEADPDRLAQILTNLIGNAIKFTDSGGITVRAERGERGCVISVEDTGVGIPPRYLSRLGERFFRVDASRSRELGGTGLGLAIVKHLVKAHGWEMVIESREGEGTAVRMTIPPPPLPAGGDEGA